MSKPVERYPRGLTTAIEALHKCYGKKPLFAPSTRRHIATHKYRELGVLLGGESAPGLPTGIFIEILGKAGAGKTTCAMALADIVINQPDAEHRIVTESGIEVVRPPRRVLYIDFEQTLDLAYFHAAVPNTVVAETDRKGKIVNMKDANVFVHQPDTLEEGGDIMLHMIGSGEFGLVIGDSIAAMLGQEERDKSMGERTIGLQAKAIGAFLRKSAYMVRRYGVPVVLINQWRNKIGVSFGDPRTAPGGAATEYWDSIRLDVSGTHKTPWFDEGKVCTIKTLKNKITGLRGAACEYHIGRNLGLSAEVELVQRCLAAGVVSWSGGLGRAVSVQRKSGDAKTFSSMRAFLETLRSRPDVAAAYSKACDAKGVTRLAAVGRGGGFSEGEV